jgi:hypothetical protein
VYSVESQQTFRRNLLLPSSGLNSKTSNKPAGNTPVFCLLHAGLLLVLLLNPEELISLDLPFNPEEGGDMLLRVVA